MDCMKKILGKMVAAIVVVLLIVIFTCCSRPYTAEHATTGETVRDGRFIAYDNGTVLDTKTNLMWAAKDNGSDINWQDAKFYCENYHGGGYKDWRMPTLDELEGLYDASKSHPASCYGRNSIHVATELIDITCFCPWASETSETTGEVDFFDFGPGIRSGFASQWTRFSRVLPVRSGK
jgi:hypothetical protein